MDFVHLSRAGAVASLVAALILAAGCTDHRGVEIPKGIPPPPGTPVPPIDLDAPGRTANLLHGWAAGQADALGISVTALEAYGYAAAVMARSEPGCGIGWTTVAGIGSVESKNGTYDGASVHADGVVSPPIRGVPLDGAPGLADLPDTDGGDRDGNSTHERAMGPLQFIPETWKRWGVDANGDGVVDVDNLDDAALTAARYLCASGGNLTTAQGWQKAVLTYNHSEDYLLAVRDRAAAYSVGTTLR